MSDDAAAAAGDDHRVLCTAQEAATWDCGEGGTCWRSKIVNVWLKTCVCADDRRGVHCEEFKAPVFPWPSTKLDERQVVLLAVGCSLAVLLILGIIFLVVRKVRQNRRRNDSLPIVTIGQTEVPATNGNINAAENGTNDKNHSQEKLNTEAKTQYM